MNCLTKLFQQKRRRIGYILAFSGPMISKRDSSVILYNKRYAEKIAFISGFAGLYGIHSNGADNYI